MDARPVADARRAASGKSFSRDGYRDRSRELSQLKTLGLEGGIDRKLELKSLEPLGALANLQYLFLAATRFADKSLAPLHGLKKLRHLSCGAYFPDEEFAALGKALPGLDCSWIEMIRKHGSIRKGLAAFSARMTRGDRLDHLFPDVSPLPSPAALKQKARSRRWTHSFQRRQIAVSGPEEFRPTHRERTGEDMSAIDAGVRAPETPWRDEIRAMLQLSWPMILTNLGQTAMTATDVLMMGRLGPDALAAGSLGANLYFMPLIFGLGPDDGGLADDRHRTRPQAPFGARRAPHGAAGPLARVMVSIPIWLFLWQAEPILNAMGQEPRLAAMAGSYVHTLMWAAMPFYGYLVLRSFISALERPRWALLIVFSAVAFNAFANWCLMYGNLGFPALGLPGSGVATTISSVMMFAGMAAVVSFERRFRRYRLFGRFWRADWPRFKAFLKLGMPIAALLLFEVSIFNAASFLMGLINAASIAAYAIAIQVASLAFMIPLGLGQAVTVRVGRAHGAGDYEAVTRAGWTAYVMGVGFMARDGGGDGLPALPADFGLHRPRRAGERSTSSRWRLPSSPSPACSRSSMARKPWAAACCAACTTRPCR